MSYIDHRPTINVADSTSRTIRSFGTTVNFGGAVAIEGVYFQCTLSTMISGRVQITDTNGNVFFETGDTTFITNNNSPNWHFINTPRWILNGTYRFFIKFQADTSIQVSLPRGDSTITTTIPTINKSFSLGGSIFWVNSSGSSSTSGGHYPFGIRAFYATQRGIVRAYSQKGIQDIRVYDPADIPKSSLRISTPNGVAAFNLVNDGTHDTGIKVQTAQGIYFVKSYV